MSWHVLRPRRVDLYRVVCARQLADPVRVLAGRRSHVLILRFSTPVARGRQLAVPRIGVDRRVLCHLNQAVLGGRGDGVPGGFLDAVVLLLSEEEEEQEADEADDCEDAHDDADDGAGREDDGDAGVGCRARGLGRAWGRRT